MGKISLEMGVFLFACALLGVSKKEKRAESVAWTQLQKEKDFANDFLGGRRDNFAP